MLVHSSLDIDERKNRAPIDVLLRTDGLRDFTLPIRADIRAEWELNEDAMHGIIVVKPADSRGDLSGGGILWKLDMAKSDTGIFGCAGFHADIGS